MKFIDKATVLSLISQYLLSDEFLKASLGSYQGAETDLKNIYIKPVLIKRSQQLSFTYRYARRDVVRNFVTDDGVAQVVEMFDREDFYAISIFLQSENIVFQRHPKKGWSYRTEAVGVVCATPDRSHDKVKDRKISDTNSAYLHALRLTDAEGKVYKNAQDKWKQINHYIEILSTALAELPENERLNVVDMGAGKGYLTFALHDYLSKASSREIHTVGIEYREDLVLLCNDIAQQSGMPGLRFEQGAIEGYSPVVSPNVLIALHACDTATDDAIFKGIQHQAELIVVAPCCHKQVRRQLESNKAKNDLSFMTRHGIFMERHAEMLTDSIRALLLEYHGYQTKVVEFVSDAHTPKNVLLIASRKKINADKQRKIQTELAGLKAYFGLDFHYLERLLNNLPSKNYRK